MSGKHRFGLPRLRTRRGVTLAAFAAVIGGGLVEMTAPSRPAGSSLPVVTLGSPVKASADGGVTSLTTPSGLNLGAGQAAVAVMGADGPRSGAQSFASVSGGGLH